MEIARISGLDLNLRKTIIVLLSGEGSEEIQQMMRESCPSWAAVTVRGYAKYLGFVLGPDRQTRTWDETSQKYLNRAALGPRPGWASTLHPCQQHLHQIRAGLLGAARGAAGAVEGCCPPSHVATPARSRGVHPPTRLDGMLNFRI